jgi:hypothetical protein
MVFSQGYAEVDKTLAGVAGFLSDPKRPTGIEPGSDSKSLEEAGERFLSSFQSFRSGMIENRGFDSHSLRQYLMYIFDFTE